MNTSSGRKNCAPLETAFVTQNFPSETAGGSMQSVQASGASAGEDCSAPFHGIYKFFVSRFLHFAICFRGLSPGYCIGKRKETFMKRHWFVPVFVLTGFL